MDPSALKVVRVKTERPAFCTGAGCALVFVGNAKLSSTYAAMSNTFVFILFLLFWFKNYIYYPICSSALALLMAASEMFEPLSIWAISLMRSSCESITMELVVPCLRSSFETR